MKGIVRRRVHGFKCRETLEVWLCVGGVASSVTFAAVMLMRLLG